jgi:hypothetical protein
MNFFKNLISKRTETTYDSANRKILLKFKRIPDGKEFDLEVDENVKIKHVKKELRKIMGTKPKHFQLLLESQWLRSRYKINKFKIKNDAIIEIKDKETERNTSKCIATSTYSRKERGASFGHSSYSGFARGSISSSGSSSSSSSDSSSDSSSSSASSPDSDHNDSN